MTIKSDFAGIVNFHIICSINLSIILRNSGFIFRPNPRGPTCIFVIIATIVRITLRITKWNNMHLFYLHVLKDNNDNEKERVLRHMLCRIITWTFNIIKDHTYNNICVHLTLRFQEVCIWKERCTAWFYYSSSKFWWLYA